MAKIKNETVGWPKSRPQRVPRKGTGGGGSPRRPAADLRQTWVDLASPVEAVADAEEEKGRADPGGSRVASTRTWRRRGRPEEPPPAAGPGVRADACRRDEARPAPGPACLGRVAGTSSHERRGGHILCNQAYGAITVQTN